MKEKFNDGSAGNSALSQPATNSTESKINNVARLAEAE